MNIEIAPHVRETASRLGEGVPYALKVLAGRLADDPDMGESSALPGILTVMIDGDLFEDCPALAVGYLREPDRLEIRYVTPGSFVRPAADNPDRQEPQGRHRERPAVPGAEAVTVREVADAWRRITGRLRAVEGDLGIRLPVELRALWLLTAGDDGAHGWGRLPGNKALMTPESVSAVHRMKTAAQAQKDRLNSGRPEEERVTVWQATWIPVIALSGRDGRHAGVPGPGRADKPGLIGGTLVWLSSIDPVREGRWQPLTRTWDR
ncbi:MULTISPECIES: hypothetical protein [unclassified Streptomyces]|uniref:hypothetical protein n=1 Tax=unclassified Streptomyces TaxID=2593676 RepID=UPI0036E35D13